MYDLTEDQGRALDDLLMLARSPSKREWAIGLKGFAGTGKTFILPSLVDSLPPNSCAMTAPTNKAVKVIDGFLRKHSVYTDTMTIHKLLGLRPKKKNGVMVLEQYGGPLPVKDYQYVGLDETSMVSAELWKHIIKANEDFGTKFFLIGDKYQLPPVGEPSSLALDVPGPELTKPIRQREESGILALCMDLREMMDRKIHKLPYVPKGPGLELAYSQAFAAVAGLFDDEWEANPDSARILAYTNDQVQRYNQAIQAIRYPGLQELFAVGEPVLFASPAMECAEVGNEAGDNEKVMFQTASEGRVMSPPALSHHPTMRKDAWQVEVKSADTGERATVWVLGDEARKKHKQDVSALWEAARAGRASYREADRAGDAFADLRGAAAQTVHTSQGSTFGTAMLDVTDALNKNPSKAEAMHCLYVGASRPSTRLVVNAGKRTPHW